MGWVSWKPKKIILAQFSWGFSLFRSIEDLRLWVSAQQEAVSTAGSPEFVLHTLRHTLRGEFGAHLEVCRAEGSRAEAVMLSWSKRRQAVCCSCAAHSTSPACRHSGNAAPVLWLGTLWQEKHNQILFSLPSALRNFPSFSKDMATNTVIHLTWLLLYKYKALI